MRVLITGGYGFIGSHVAEQFYKEGYEIHIIDNLSTGHRENITFKHKAHIISITDPKCKEIFAANRFDFVIHLAAQISVARSIQNPIYDAEANIIGLLNMLQFSQQSNVRKFIFASSAAIYGNNTNLPLTEHETPLPIAPYGVSKWVGEQYCSNWAAQHDLDAVCFRLSNVFGPRQTSEGEGGVVATFITKALQNETVEIYGNGEQTRDFIYVKDVAHAIFRATQSFITGTYNLSTNIQTSVNQLVQVLQAQGYTLKTTYTQAREGDIMHSSLSNEKIKTELDWVPKYSIEESLIKTYEWGFETFNHRTLKVKNSPKTTKIPAWALGVKPYLENSVIFLVISLFLWQLRLPTMSIFVFGVFYIMTIGSIYGNKQAFTGGVLAFSLLVADYLSRGRELISLLYDSTFLFQIVTFLFIGLVVGYSVQRKNEKITEQNEQIHELQMRYDFLEEVHAEVRDVKDELQYRVKNNEDSFGKIHSIMKTLDQLEPEKIFTSAVNVIESVMHCEDVAIYIFNSEQSYLWLIAHSDLDKSEAITNSLKVDESPFVQQLLTTEQPFINRTLVAQAPLMAAPIYYDNNIQAIITIGKMPFENFSHYHENLFLVLKELIQSSLARAFEFIKVSEDQRFIKNTAVLKIDAFKEVLAAKQQAQTIHHMPYHVLTLQVAPYHLQQTAYQIQHLIRETDYLGYDNQQLFILFSNLQTQDLPVILQRFQQAGFNFSLDQQVSYL
ncbi:NAD-dependent epimerase/dehydratase family protein [Solibacillus sp. FSL H8-0523]|uniref:NAD-dependent epimerase/dehydratase family protein n=1 Tax=Solibacillus sp. FSL H8-0523 TaxID=2954511 RepID=UPI00310124B9